MCLPKAPRHQKLKCTAGLCRGPTVTEFSVYTPELWDTPSQAQNIL